MTTPFAKGLLKVILYYTIGFSLSWLLNEITGTVGHAPGLDYLGGFVTLLGGAIWIIVALIRLILNNHDKKNLGCLVMNFIVMVSVIAYIKIDIDKETATELSTNKADIITIYKDSSSDKASIVNGFGDTLFSKTGDTTIVEKTSKDRINYR